MTQDIYNERGDSNIEQKVDEAMKQTKTTENANSGRELTLGEKIRELRKAKGLSQEELAARINVSRQAVSKWETDLSLPDIDNIVQLSRLLGVSTDYLLLDEPQQLGNGSTTAKNDMYLRQGVAVAIGLAVIGLLLSLAVWFTWQTIITVMIGVAVQIIGVIIFELVLSRNGKEKRQQQRRWFYAIIPWLILPFPIKFAVDYLFNYYPRAYNSALEIIVMLLLYLLICGFISWRLRRSAKRA